MMSLALFALLQLTCGGAQPLSPPGLDPSPNGWGAEEGALFGTSVAMDGDLAVVGAPLESYIPDGTIGGAWVYRRTAAGWVLEQELFPLPAPPGTPAGARFGAKVAVDAAAERVVIGDWSIGAWGASNTGGAIVFERIAGSWVQVAIVVGVPNESYAREVVLDGDVLAISAYGAFNPVLIFERSADTWSLADSLGGGSCKLSLEGDVLAVGYPTTTTDGRVSFFRRGIEGWEFDDVIHPPVPSGGEFGASIDFEGDTAVVGEPRGIGSGPKSGAVHVFRHNGSSWEWAQTLFEDPAGDYDQFGYSVEISGDRLLVGHPGATFSSGFSVPEQVHVYERANGGDFERVGGIQSPYGLNDRLNFGDTLALSGDDALIGAWLADEAFQNSGEVWALDVSPLSSTPESLSLSTGGSATLALFAGEAQADLPYLVLGSLSGIAPGVVVNGLTIALNPDFYTSLLLSPATILVDGFGVLSAEGCGTAEVVVPAGAPASLVGSTLHHAYVALNPATLDVLFVSEPEPIQLGL